MLESMAALTISIEKLTANTIEGRCTQWAVLPKPGTILDFITRTGQHYYAQIESVLQEPDSPDALKLMMLPVSGQPDTRVQSVKTVSPKEYFRLRLEQSDPVAPISLNDIVMDLNDSGHIVYVKPSKVGLHRKVIHSLQEARLPILILDPVGINLSETGVKELYAGIDARLSIQDVGISNFIEWIVANLPKTIQAEASRFLLSLVPATPDFIPLQYFVNHPAMQQHPLSAVILHQLYAFHTSRLFTSNPNNILRLDHLPQSLHINLSQLPSEFLPFAYAGLLRMASRQNLHPDTHMMLVACEIETDATLEFIRHTRHRTFLVSNVSRYWDEYINDRWEEKRVFGDNGIQISGDITSGLDLFIPDKTVEEPDFFPEPDQPQPPGLIAEAAPQIPEAEPMIEPSGFDGQELRLSDDNAPIEAIPQAVQPLEAEQSLEASRHIPAEEDFQPSEEPFGELPGLGHLPANMPLAPLEIEAAFEPESHERPPEGESSEHPLEESALAEENQTRDFETLMAAAQIDYEEAVPEVFTPIPSQPESGEWELPHPVFGDDAANISDSLKPPPLENLNILPGLDIENINDDDFAAFDSFMRSVPDTEPVSSQQAQAVEPAPKTPIRSFDADPDLAEFDRFMRSTPDATPTESLTPPSPDVFDEELSDFDGFLRSDHSTPMQTEASFDLNFDGLDTLPSLNETVEANTAPSENPPPENVASEEVNIETLLQHTLPAEELPSTTETPQPVNHPPEDDMPELSMASFNLDFGSLDLDLPSQMPASDTAQPEHPPQDHAPDTPVQAEPKEPVQMLSESLEQSLAFEEALFDSFVEQSDGIEEQTEAMPPFQPLAVDDAPEPSPELQESEHNALGDLPQLDLDLPTSFDSFEAELLSWNDTAPKTENAANEPIFNETATEPTQSEPAEAPHDESLTLPQEMILNPEPVALDLPGLPEALEPPVEASQSAMQPNPLPPAENDLMGLDFSGLELSGLSSPDEQGLYLLVQREIPNITKGMPQVDFVPGQAELSLDGELGTLELEESPFGNMAPDLIETVHEKKLETDTEQLELDAEYKSSSQTVYDKVYIKGPDGEASSDMNRDDALAYLQELGHNQGDEAQAHIPLASAISSNPEENVTVVGAGFNDEDLLALLGENARMAAAQPVENAPAPAPAMPAQEAMPQEEDWLQAYLNEGQSPAQEEGVSPEHESPGALPFFDLDNDALLDSSEPPTFINPNKHATLDKEQVVASGEAFLDMPHPAMDATMNDPQPDANLEALLALNMEFAAPDGDGSENLLPPSLRLDEEPSAQASTPELDPGLDINWDEMENAVSASQQPVPPSLQLEPLASEELGNDFDLSMLEVTPPESTTPSAPADIAQEEEAPFHLDTAALGFDDEMALDFDFSDFKEPEQQATPTAIHQQQTEGMSDILQELNADEWMHQPPHAEQNEAPANTGSEKDPLDFLYGDQNADDLMDFSLGLDFEEARPVQYTELHDQDILPQQADPHPSSHTPPAAEGMGIPVVKSNLAPSVSVEYKAGEEVRHQRYGKGVIKRVITMDDNQVILNITFEGIGKRLLDPKLTQLEKVS